MSADNGNAPAYPKLGAWLAGPNGSEYVSGSDGLTKREAFAMAAMQGILAGPEAVTEACAPGDIARYAAQAADALLAELAKERT